MALATAQPFVAVLSNVPGPIKPRTVEAGSRASGEQHSNDNATPSQIKSASSGNDSTKQLLGETESIGGILVPAGGATPMALTIISYLGTYKLSLTADLRHLPDPDRFMQILERNLDAILKHLD